MAGSSGANKLSEWPETILPVAAIKTHKQKNATKKQTNSWMAEETPLVQNSCSCLRPADQQCVTERATRYVQGWFFPALNCCRRVWFVRSVPAATFYPHRPPDSQMTRGTYAKSHSLPCSCQFKFADDGSYITSKLYFSLLYIYWLEGHVWHILETNDT